MLTKCLAIPLSLDKC